MKKIFLTAVLGAAFVGVQIPQARAHDHGFNPVGAVIGGIVAGAVIADAFAPHPVYYAPAPAYCPPQVVYAPAPVYYAAPQPVYYAAPSPAFYYREPAVRVRFGYGWGWDRHHERDFDHRDRR